MASMFYNTVGGLYKRDKTQKRVSYTFPDNAYCEIDGVKIPLGQLEVQCQADQLDGATLEHFTKVSSMVAAHSKNIFNTSILINDNDISGTGYPLRDEFEKNGIEFIDAKTFNERVDELNRTNPAKDDTNYIHMKKIESLIKKSGRDNRDQLAVKIKEIVNKDGVFPKKLSLIYDDRRMQHASHIVLDFQSENTCTLHIDNTLSPTIAIIPNMMGMLLANGIKIDEYDEAIDLSDPKGIQLTANGKEPIFLALFESADAFFKKHTYARMKAMIKALGFNVIDVEVHYTLYNIKSTFECIPFAIQNKLDYVTGNQTYTAETAGQKGTRIRAQKAILSYLVTGVPLIAHFDESVRRDTQCPVLDENEWYPNYPEVCEELQRRIKALSFADLRTLYLSQQIDAQVELSYKIRQLILQGLREKLDSQGYCATTSNIDPVELEALESWMAPSLLFVMPTVYVSNDWHQSNQKMDQLEGMLRVLKI